MSGRVETADFDLAGKHAIPFEVQLYKSGNYQVVTRSGLSVYHLSTDSLCAVVVDKNGDYVLRNYEPNGLASIDGSLSDNDLFMFKTGDLQ